MTGFIRLVGIPCIAAVGIPRFFSDHDVRLLQYCSDIGTILPRSCQLFLRDIDAHSLEITIYRNFHNRRRYWTQQNNDAL